jgi:hypothetical protein
VICNKNTLAKKSALQTMYERDEDLELFFQHLYANPNKIHTTMPALKNFIEKNLTNDMDRETIQQYVSYVANVAIFRQNIFINQHKQFARNLPWQLKAE